MIYCVILKDNSPTQYQLCDSEWITRVLADYLEYTGLHISFIVNGYKEDPACGIDGKFLNWVELLSLEHVL